MDKIRVVLADDHPFLRAGLRFFLERQEDVAVVGEAGDGEAAVQLVRRDCPDVLLLDARLPKRDGIAVVKEVRRTAPRTQILIFTGYGDPEIARALLALGVRGYLVKTAGFKELGAVLRQIYRGETYVDPDIARATGGAAPGTRGLDAARAGRPGARRRG